MGTSSPYGGPKNGLEPDWLDDIDSPGSIPDGGDQDADTGPADGNDGDDGGPENPQPTDGLQPTQPPISLGPARGGFTRFTNSGNVRALSGAVSKYIASSRGSGGVVRRMPSSVRTSSGVASLASKFAQEGPTEALRQFNLQDLAGRPAIEVFDALVDELCPEGGTIDEAIARDAFIDAVALFAEQDLGNFDELTPDQINEFLVEVMAGCIVSKVINEIGTNSLHGSASDNVYRDAEATLRDYTSGAVRDELASSFDNSQSITSDRMEALISDIFASSLDVLQATLEAEA